MLTFFGFNCLTFDKIKKFNDGNGKKKFLFKKNCEINEFDSKKFIRGL